jgi:heptosyltransferase-1
VRILLVKLSAIGDVIQAFAALDTLRALYPHAQIDWAVDAKIAPLLRAHPHLHTVIALPIKEPRKWRAGIRALRLARYDLLFDLQGNMKSACIALLARAAVKVGFCRQDVSEWGNLLVPMRRCSVRPYENARHKMVRLCGGEVLNPPEPLLLALTPDEEARCRELVCPARPLLMICPGARWENKRLSTEALCGFLARFPESFFLFIYSTPQEELEAKQLAVHFASRARALGGLSLPLLQRLMARCDEVIAVDSAALHLAATTGVATFSIFGPSRPEYYKPPGDQHRAIQGRCPYGRSFPDRCPVLRTCPTGACMKDFTADRLYQLRQQ